MGSNRKYLIFIALLILIFSIGNAYAGDLDNATLEEVASDSLENVGQDISSQGGDYMLSESSEITVNNWDELQYYCSQSDRNYTLKLKENTNFYPTNPKDSSYQIEVHNNVTIVGSSGSYFGDASSNARSIEYVAINVAENSGLGITLKNITFKWISTEFQPSAMFIQMAGSANNMIENCDFSNCTMTGGHSSIVYLMRGNAVISGCSFINCTTDYGCLSIYDPKEDPTKTCTSARMEVSGSYFEGNYARTEPGCINNCGVLVVNNSTFYRNTAFWWAGAIHTHGGANTTIYDSNFTDNLAGWNGGALYTYSYLQIYNTVFIGNNCTTNNGGGAIGASKYLHAPYIYIVDSLFMNNENLCWAYTNESTTGLGRGGAISIMDEGGLTVLNTTFIRNSASMGTAICAITQGSLYGSPDVVIVGNRFINHTRVGDVLVIKLDYDSVCDIRDNYFSNNSIEFSKLKLEADERIGDEVTLHIDAALKNRNFYDEDILERFGYDVYVDGAYLRTVHTTDFTLNLKNIEKAQVYVVPYVSISKSNEVSVGLPREYIYVSQKYGNDNNNGSKNAPVSTLSKAVELASQTGYIHILDGAFSQSNLDVNYNLTIIAETNVVITSSGNVFNFGDVDVSLSNIIFRNSRQVSSISERLINHGNGALKIQNCTFEDNSYNTLIESTGLVELNDLKFINNVGILIQSDYYSISSSIFDSNSAITTKAPTLIRSNDAFKCSISNSIFSDNDVYNGCVYFVAQRSNQNTLTITETTFCNNTGNDGSSGIYMYSGGLLNVKSSLFINNTDIGKTSAVILTSTEVHVSDSIFLGNAYENTNNAVINAKSQAILKSIYCDGNWWGNTVNNMETAPPISSSSNCNNWLFLNVSANATELFIGQSALVYLSLNNVYTKEGEVTYWDAGALPALTLTIKTNGGIASRDNITLENAMGRLTYTSTEAEGNLTVNYNNVNAILMFTKGRYDPQMTVNVSDIFVDDNQIIEITLPGDATGNLTLKIGEITEVKEVLNSKTIFNLSNLTAGEYAGTITYSGDGCYTSSVNEVKFNVDKYESSIKVSVGDVEVGEDVILTINVSPSISGNITLIINNREETLPIVNSKANYTIKSITRGDYLIKAIFEGDYKYLPSQDSTRFSVDKLNATITVKVSDIVYGQDELVEITIDGDATGNITVFVEGIVKTERIDNGKATINISKLNAGAKEILIMYNGDNNYNPHNRTASFNVSRAVTPLIVNVENIKIGEDENIEINVLSGVDGNITISCAGQEVVKTVNLLGRVTWKLSDLTVGNYTVIAVLSSENYENTENRCNFTVSDYKAPQWPNEGGNVQNEGRSLYEINSNGAVIWTYNLAGNLLGNLAIDSEGNIYLITTSGLYSINGTGTCRWNYNFTNNANYSGIAVGRDVIVVPEGGNTLHMINQSTGERFGNSNIYQGSSLFSPIIDSNANIYISSEYQHASGDYNLVVIPYSIWKHGGNPIMITLGNDKPASSPVIVDDNYVVVACENALKIIDLSQNKVISSISGSTHSIRPVVGPGNIIYAVIGDTLRALTINGNSIWQTRLSGIGKYLVLDEESGLYSINSNGNLCRYDIVDGTESVISNLTFTSGILIGDAGEVYVGCENMLYVFDSQSNILYKSNMGDKIIGTPIVDNNGIIYLTTVNGLHALGSANLKDPELNVDIEDIDAGESLTVNVQVSGEATGIINVEINGVVYSKTIEDSNVVFTIPDLQVGRYTAEITYSGDRRFASKGSDASFSVIGNTQIIIENVTCYYSGRFSAVLQDSNSRPISGEKLRIAIGNEVYELTTDSNGRVTTDLNMTPSTYQVSCEFAGKGYLKPSVKTADINVLSSIKASDMKRGYNSGVDFKAIFLTGIGSPLAKTQVTFIVNGKDYNVITDVNGQAVLNKKLAAGTYTVIAVNPITGERSEFKLNIVKRIINNKDLTMDYLDGSLFKVRVIGDDGNVAGAGQVVKFKIGSLTYSVKTDKYGYASLKNTLTPKTYAIKTEYKGYAVSNRLVVKQVLKASNVIKKKAKYYKFSATLKTSKGKAISGKNIVFTIKGKKYIAKTNNRGIATATIKLNLNVGKYVVVSTYSKTSIKNILTIRK